MVWTLVVLASLTLSGYFLYTNLEDYRDDTTIVTLYDQQATLDDNVFFPSVTICSSNQIRLATTWHFALYPFGQADLSESNRDLH